MAPVKIAIIGGSNVGKTSLVDQLTSHNFFRRHSPTIDDCYLTTIDLDGREVEIEINDTAGSDEYEIIRNKRMTECDGFILVYSITSINSFSEAKQILEQVYAVTGRQKLPIVLVGNKLDLHGQRLVPYTVGEITAMDLSCPFMEVSAMDRDAVVSVFTELFRQIDSLANEPEPEEVLDKETKSKCCVVL